MYQYADLPNHFTVWFTGKPRANGKPSKIPCCVATGQALNGTVIADNLTDFFSAQAALDASGGRYSGVCIHAASGIHNADGERLYLLDFDNIEDNHTARAWYERFRALTDCHTSPSGTGGHALAWGPDINVKINRRDLGIEIYTYGQHLTLTDQQTGTGEIAHIESELNELVTLLKTPQETAQEAPQATIENTGLLSDEEVLAAAFRAKNGGYIRSVFEGGQHKGDDQSETGVLHSVTTLISPYCSSIAQVCSVTKQSAHYSERWEQPAGGGETQLEHSAKKAFEQRGFVYTPPKQRKRKAKQPETITNQTGFNCTDLGNAERFVNQFGDKVRYVHPWKTWLVWSGAHWERDETGRAEKLAKRTVRSIYKEAADTLSDDRRKELSKHAQKSEAASAIANMLSLARSEDGVPIAPGELDKDPFVLNCENGIVDLATGKLLPHDTAIYHTKIIPSKYDPHAVCPTWLSFLSRIMDDDKELIGYIQRSIGYSLTGNTSEQCLFFLYGHGANGKSTFIETLAALSGDYGLKTPTETLMVKKSGGGVPNDVARLHGARLVTASEVDEGNRLNESLVKDLTGGDTITARFMRAEFFDFKPVFKLWMFGNHKPVIRGTDKGIWRRIRLIPFEVTIPDEEKDRRLPEKLRAEMPGILAWAVRGCLEWQRIGLKPPTRIVQATSDYQAEMDILGNFISECCVIGNDEKCSAKELYQAYKTWATDCGEFVANQRRFGQGLSERGLERVRRGAGIWWYGIGLNPDINTGGGVGWQSQEVEV